MGTWAFGGGSKLPRGLVVPSMGFGTPKGMGLPQSPWSCMGKGTLCPREALFAMFEGWPMELGQGG